MLLRQNEDVNFLKMPTERFFLMPTLIVLSLFWGHFFFQLINLRLLLQWNTITRFRQNHFMTDFIKYQFWDCIGKISTFYFSYFWSRVFKKDQAHFFRELSRHGMYSLCWIFSNSFKYSLQLKWKYKNISPPSKQEKNGTSQYNVLDGFSGKWIYLAISMDLLSPL